MNDGSSSHGTDHPPHLDFRYPKDNEKQLLAIKSGLTRSQVLPALGSLLGFYLLRLSEKGSKA